MNAERPDQTAIAIAEREFSIEKSITEGHQLSKMMDKYGKPILKLVVGLINRQAEFYNVRKEVTETQATMIAQTLIDEYSVENIEDVVLMFKMARAGNFGTIYGKLDGETIMSWMALFLDRKYDKLEQMHQNEKHQKTDLSEQVLEVIKQNIENRPDRTDRNELTRQSWLQWFEDNKETMTKENLLSLRNLLKDLTTNSSEHYAEVINKINELL